MSSPVVRAAMLFRDAFGTEPAAVASAPGRVNLIGEHVDYHGGHVLPAATAERTAVAVGPAEGFHAVAEDAARFAAADAPWPPVHRGAWADYVAGAVLEAAKAAGGPGGVRAAVASDVPAGAGVSSSAALEVASAAAMLQLSGAAARPREVAMMAHRAETEFVGVPCGYMDQMASACAPPRQALLLDCRTLAFETVDVPIELVLADSGERHALVTGGYKERRREGEEALALLRAKWGTLEWLTDIPPARLPEATQILPPVLPRRVRHVVNENQRAHLAARALDDGDPEAFGVLVNASHASLRDLYECSTPRLDTIADAARQLPNVLGARLVGAGWGGSVLVVCEEGAGGSVAARLRGDAALALPDVRTVIPGEGLRIEPHP